MFFSDKIYPTVFVFTSVAMMSVVKNSAVFVPHVSAAHFNPIADFYRYAVSPFEIVGDKDGVARVDRHDKTLVGSVSCIVPKNFADPSFNGKWDIRDIFLKSFFNVHEE